MERCKLGIILHPKFPDSDRIGVSAPIIVKVTQSVRSIATRTGLKNRPIEYLRLESTRRKEIGRVGLLRFQEIIA